MENQSDRAANTCPPITDLPFGSKGQIDKLGRRCRGRFVPPEVIRGIMDYRQFRLQCILTSFGIIHSLGLPQRGLLSARLKRIKSIVRKMSRGNVPGLSKIYDIVAFRIICERLSDVYELSDRLRPQSKKVRDYLDSPHFSGTGYRGIHHIFAFDQQLTEGKTISVTFEVQVRTYLQHQWAIWLETEGKERAKAGFAGWEDDEEAMAEKARYKSVSDEIKEWEEANRDTPQTALSPISNDKNFIVAENHRITNCADAGEAIRHINSLEENDMYEDGFRYLLLMGIGAEQDVEKIIRKTHPNFFVKSAPPPEIPPVTS